MYRQLVKRVAICLVLLISVILLWVLFIDGEKLNIEYSIDLSGAALPSRIELTLHGKLTSSDVTWLYERPREAMEKRRFRETWFAPVSYDHIWHATWSAEPDFHIFNVYIIDYENTLMSLIGFELNNPAARQTTDNYFYVPENIVPEGWERMPGPDRERVQCGNGDEDLCSDWFYVARYGQYLLIVHFWSMSNIDSFRGVVQGITEEFEAHLYDPAKR